MATKAKPSPVLSFTVKKQEYTLPLIWVPYECLELWTKNPRYGEAVAEFPDLTPADMLEMLADEAKTRDLRKSIEENGGLAEPIIVYKKDDKTYEVREGNRRTAAWQKLYEGGKHLGRSNPWAQMPCYLLATEQEKAFMSWLAIVHIQGKHPWNSYAKALYAQDMLSKGVDEDVVALDCGLTKPEMNRQKTTVELLKKYKDQTGDDNSQSKFWHCYELAKIGDVKDNPTRLPAIFDAIKEGKFSGSRKIRALKDIVGDEAAFQRFITSKPTDKHALEEAVEIAHDADAEKTKAFKAILKATTEISGDMGGVVKHIQRPDGSKLFFRLLDKMVEAAKLAGLKDRLATSLNTDQVLRNGRPIVEATVSKE